METKLAVAARRHARRSLAVDLDEGLRGGMARGVKQIPKKRPIRLAGDLLHSEPRLRILFGARVEVIAGFVTRFHVCVGALH